ncbi:hypothetical protein Bamb_1230 [Burkholderia ambifaria AMMD]|uniref:Uncharacterized protein n=1 Tax=Burkholderia ambifaria (strain ATCC BAA-244 / DSM 16087 / CCUG 44356 / LMG 19182 / AMMD) TaxID=339670 RepID=Q0BGD5_BURCM|nr:hypothetical protein Bamb_1230 [Burkholderia ambifaria AMMD]
MRPDGAEAGPAKALTSGLREHARNAETRALIARSAGSRNRPNHPKSPAVRRQTAIHLIIRAAIHANEQWCESRRTVAQATRRQHRPDCVVTRRNPESETASGPLGRSECAQRRSNPHTTPARRGVATRR